MALALFDRVQETTTTTGTGTITLAGAVSGFQSFAVVGNGNTCYYTIVDGAAWEVGIGTYTASGTTLARTTVLSNSSGTTSPITLSAGSKNVFLTYPAEKSVNLDASGNVSPLGTVSSGVWQGTIVGTLYGGTGVNNGSNTITLAGSVTHAGAFARTFTATGTTSVTLPTSGYLLSSATQVAAVTGTPSSSNYLRGDGTWAAVPSSMVYPGSGIPNSTSSAWGTSYSVSGSGSVVLTTGASIAGATMTGTLTFANSTSPYSNTIQFGDNTGWNFRFMTSVSGTPTTRFTFGDNGNFTSVGTVTGTILQASGNGVYTFGQMRATGWYGTPTGSSYTGLAIEMGVSGGNGQILVYNRDTSTYGTLNISGSASNMTFSGSTINVSSGTLQQGGNAVITTGGGVVSYIGINGGTTYGIGVQSHAASGFFDTVDSGVSTDPLELVYYSGASVIVGNGTYGSKPLYAGSLYDAGSRVVSVAGGQSVQSTTYFASNVNSSTSYIYAGIQLRESNYGGSSAYLAPRLAFHWGGVVASQINVSSSGCIQMLNNPGTTLENIGFNNAYMDGRLKRNNPGVGYLDGQYNSVETGSTTGPIYTIGGSYYPTSTSLNNMYGTGYCIGNVAGSAGSSAGSVWGLYVASNGVARVFLDSDFGRIWNTGDTYVGAGIHTGGSTGGGFFGSANASLFYNGGDICEVRIASGNGGGYIEFDQSSGSDWHFAGSTNSNMYFTQTSVADRMYLNGSNGIVYVPGTLSKGGGSFDIPHPIKPGFHLRHSFVEGPRVDLIYRGHATLVDGVVVLNMDTDAVSEGGQTMTPGTFEALTRDADIFVQNQTGWEPVRGSLEGATLTIVCKDLTSTDTVSWMVVAERKDAFLHEVNTTMTDDQGRMVLEYEYEHPVSEAATYPLRTKIDIFEGL